MEVEVKARLMSTEPKKRPSEPDGDLLLDAPIMKLAVVIWTVGIFAIAIVLARAGLTSIGIMVLVAGAAVGIFAFWEPIKELYSWLRHEGQDR